MTKFKLGGFLPKKIRERNKSLKDIEDFQKGKSTKNKVKPKVTKKPLKKGK